MQVMILKVAYNKHPMHSLIFNKHWPEPRSILDCSLTFSLLAFLFLYCVLMSYFMLILKWGHSLHTGGYNARRASHCTLPNIQCHVSGTNVGIEKTLSCRHNGHVTYDIVCHAQIGPTNTVSSNEANGEKGKERESTNTGHALYHSLSQLV